MIQKKSLYQYHKQIFCLYGFIVLEHCTTLLSMRKYLFTVLCPQSFESVHHKKLLYEKKNRFLAEICAELRGIFLVTFYYN